METNRLEAKPAWPTRVLNKPRARHVSERPPPAFGVHRPTTRRRDATFTTICCGTAVPRRCCRIRSVRCSCCATRHCRSVRQWPAKRLRFNCDRNECSFDCDRTTAKRWRCSTNRRWIIRSICITWWIWAKAWRTTKISWVSWAWACRKKCKRSRPTFDSGSDRLWTKWSCPMSAQCRKSEYQLNLQQMIKQFHYNKSTRFVFDRLKAPCPDCAAPYGFINHMPLDTDAVRFARLVNQTRISGNLDAPEGGFDAIMQSIVCERQVGWRNHSRRLLLFSTDSGFHYAGDGKVNDQFQFLITILDQNQFNFIYFFRSQSIGIAFAHVRPVGTCCDHTCFDFFFLYLCP